MFLWALLLQPSINLGVIAKRFCHFKNAFSVRYGQILKRGRERDWDIHRAHAFHRSIQIIERFISDHRSEFSRNAVLLIAFVNDNGTAGLLNRLHDGLFVEWDEGAGVYDGC